MIGGHGVNDPALVETLCSNSADAIAWLAEQGIDMPSVSSFGGASVKRIHRPLDDEGKVISVGSYMIPRLEDKCEEEGVEILLNTTATKILTDAEGAAVGIEATDNKTGAPSPSTPRRSSWPPAALAPTWIWSVEYKPDLAGFMTPTQPAPRARASTWPWPSAQARWIWTRSRSPHCGSQHRRPHHRGPARRRRHPGQRRGQTLHR